MFFIKLIQFQEILLIMAPQNLFVMFVPKHFIIRSHLKVIVVFTPETRPVNIVTTPSPLLELSTDT